MDFFENQGLNFFTSLEFKRDGSYEITTYRDPDTGALVVFYHFIEGHFTLEGENITFDPTRRLFIGNEVPWGPSRILLNWK